MGCSVRIVCGAQFITRYVEVVFVCKVCFAYE